MKSCDCIVDLQSGDTGKGKVTHSLLENNPGYYDLVLRYNGGSNAGHTIYHKGQKIVTHQVPAGVFYGIKSLIGLGCVVNIGKLYQEIGMLQSHGIDTRGLIYVDQRAHCVTLKHLEEDGQDISIGTTKQGIGPAYKSKYGRTGIRIQDHKDIDQDYFKVVDCLQLYDSCSNVLAEGAQGFQLDIDWGDYPFVTSSHCTVGSVVLNGISPRKINNVYGVMKAYETYVGAKDFGMGGPDKSHFEKIAELGNEFGATTGRPRKVNWINIDQIQKAIKVNGVNKLIINKFDILQQVGVFGYIQNDTVTYINTPVEFEIFLKHVFIEPENVAISYSPHQI